MIKVSVGLITYNHAKYLEQAILSVLNQKTNFDFELIIHDDASTDETTEIVKQYVAKYPEKVKAIIQTENQYSKSKDVYLDFIVPLMSGEYCCILEGDDYWNDNHKLQMQADFLDSNPEYISIVHNTIRINEITKKTDKMNLYSEERDVTLNDILENDSHSFHINSIMYRKYINDNLPSFMYISKGYFLDLSIRLLLCFNGKIKYAPRVMSVYRYLVPGSDSDRLKGEQGRKKNSEVYFVICKLLESANEFSDYKYNSLFEKYILLYQYKANELAENYCELIKYKYKNIFNCESFKRKVLIYFGCYMPKTHVKCKEFRNLKLKKSNYLERQRTQNARFK